jgi:predicted AAA+ superfamily ATPase
LSSKSKYYAGDLGILSSIIGFDIKSAKGYRLENLIFLELKRRGYEIFTYAGKNNYEIDFVAKKMDTIIYYQITDRLSDENYIREIRSLLSVNDNYEKIILTNEIDENLVLQPNGIKIFLITE